MLTPIVTEIRRATEPVARDTFITEVGGRSPRRPGLPGNAASLSGRRSRRRRPAVGPARLA